MRPADCLVGRYVCARVFFCGNNDTFTQTPTVDGVYNRMIEPLAARAARSECPERKHREREMDVASLPQALFNAS